MFILRKRYFLELLMPETMKLLGSTISKITKGKNGENVPPLEITQLSARFRSLIYLCF